MQFPAQRFSEGAPGKMHQAKRPPASGDGNQVSGRQLAQYLSVRAQDRRRSKADHFCFDFRRDGKNKGPV